jgi:hypothetical protein
MPREGDDRERGFALLVVLWTMVLLALLASQVTGAGRALFMKLSGICWTGPAMCGCLGTRCMCWPSPAHA